MELMTDMESIITRSDFCEASVSKISSRFDSASREMFEPVIQSL
jgi:hypothetical protein